MFSPYLQTTAKAHLHLGVEHLHITAALYCTVIHITELYFTDLQRTAICYTVLHSTTLYYIVLSSNSKYYTQLHRTTPRSSQLSSEVFYSLLTYFKLCNVLMYTVQIYYIQFTVITVICTPMLSNVQCTGVLFTS